MDQIKNLGKYHILERLSADEVAEIYKVKTIGIAGFEKIQVLKRILPPFGEDPNFIRAFIEEAKVAFSLNHRNIVQVFEFGKADGDLFLAMEYIPGVNLKKVMRQGQLFQRILPAGLTCYLMGEVAAGLEYAHRKSDHFGKELSIVHCDMSPQNIACSFEGSVKILDFGISKVTWTATSPANRLYADPRYLSPEQVRGATLDARSDLFSFGVILWELLTGEPLFLGDNQEAVMRNIVEAPIPSAISVNPDVPPPLDKLAERCLVRGLDHRIKNASDLQMELHRIQRMLGAVIGSRALSAVLEELFPAHGDIRDVRQEISMELSIYTSSREVPPPQNDLIDAASELAEPPNPPAVPVKDSQWNNIPRRARRKHVPLIDLASDPDIITNSTQGAPSAKRTEDVGVLRSGRDFNDESRAAPQTQFSIRSKRSSEEAHLHPLQLAEDEIKEFGALPPQEFTESGQDFIDTEDLDEADTAPPHQTGEFELQALAHAGAGQPLQSGVTAQDLGEKKRYIAVAVFLEGGNTAQEEAAALITDIAFKLDGIVHENSLDRLVVLFGLPTSDENDIVTAAKFSLDALEALTNLEVETGQHASEGAIRIRIGIRVGTARMKGLPSREGYQILGNTISEVKILARHAAPGEILLAGTAAPLALTYYVLRDVQPLHRHGKTVHCRRLMAPRTRAWKRKTDPPCPIFGREVEARAIQNAWRETVINGTQHSILIAGEHGVGKSRLIEEFLHRHASDAHVIALGATPHRYGVPYSLLSDLLRGVTGVRSASGPKSRRRLARSLLHILGQEDLQTKETLEAVLAPHENLQRNSGEAFSRHRVYRATRRLLDGLAAALPTVIVLEDLHWADGSSMECIRLLIEEPGDTPGPLFFLLSIRPEEGVIPQNIFDSESTSFMLLDELDVDDRQRLIIEELGGRATSSMMEEIQRRAGGNPFYIRELARSMNELESNVATEMSPTVQGVLAALVDRLHPQVKLVLQHAAVIGPTFREGILAKLVGRNPARSLAILRNRGIIVPGLRTAVPTYSTYGLSEQFEREWTFRHVLVQEVVYEAISAVARRKLHLLVAEIMAKRITSGSSDPPAEVGRHFDLGGQSRLAGDFYLQAAHEAAAAFASREALELYGHALRLAEGDEDHRYLALAGREWMHGQLGNHDAQVEDLKKLRGLAGDDPARVADLRNREALLQLRLGEYYNALSSAEEAEAASAKAHYELARGEALLLRGEAYERLNDHPRAIEATSKALRIFEKQKSVRNQVRAYIGLARICLIQAQYDEAFSHYDPALELIKNTGDQWLERILRNNLASVHYCRGDFSQAITEAFASLKLCERFGDRAREGDNASVLGIIYLELGQYDRSRQNLEEALAIHKETGSKWSLAETMLYAGMLEGGAGQFPTALSLLEQSKALSESIGAQYIVIKARNAMAWVLCERNQPQDAARALEEATLGTEAAKSARLIVGEIPGLSRSARATALGGNLESARALSRRAIELLNEQRIIESSEEEIYYTHYRILTAMQDPGALDFLELSHNGFMSKLARLEAEELKISFAARVRLNVAIQRDFQRIHKE